MTRTTERPEPAPARRRLPFWLGVLASLVLAWLIDAFLLESVRLPSASMRPTLLPNERAFLQKALCSPIQRFDVVVIHSEALGHRIVKRVVGLPGDHLRLEEGWRVILNGKPLHYAPTGGDGTQLSEEGRHLIQRRVVAGFDFPTKFGREEITIAAGQYYVLGDNRLASEDSRSFGPIDQASIEGKLRLVWYSYDRRGGGLRTRRILAGVR